MDINLTMIITILAVLAILFAVWQVFALRTHIPGGMVGKSWKFLASLVLLFAVGYIAMPFLGNLSPDKLQMLVAVIFLFGAIYVVITISLIKRIIVALSE